MFPSSNRIDDKYERRSEERRSCSPASPCQVINPLDERVSPAGPWNFSSGGVCVLVESQYPPGARLEIEFDRPPHDPPRQVFAEVVHTLLVPSFHEMWLTGCSFLGDRLEEEELNFHI